MGVDGGLDLGAVDVLSAGDVMSLLRSTTVMKPSWSLTHRSPEWNQPSRKASAVACGFRQYSLMTVGPR